MISYEGSLLLSLLICFHLACFCQAPLVIDDVSLMLHFVCLVIDDVSLMMLLLSSSMGAFVIDVTFVDDVFVDDASCVFVSCSLGH